MTRRRHPAKPLPELGCHNCRHWREDTDAPADERDGQCRAHPPAVLWDAEDAAIFAAWPPTGAADCCGDHAPRLQ